MAAQPPTRRDPPTPDDAAAGLGAATLAQLVAAGAAVGPAAVGAVGKGAAVGAGALPHRTAQAAAEAIERALDGFWMQQLAIARAKARARLGEALPHWSPSMLDRAVAEELAYEEEFKRKSRARWARDLPAALGDPDPEARRKALKALLDRERRYAEQRYAAIVRRVEARVERERVREASPLGAYWTMDPRLKTHTPGCVALAGHFWPWSVVDRVHPPVHATCGCRLWGLDDALRRGWMRADQVPDEADALARARLLARRIEELHGELSEAELREALTEAVGRYDLRYPKGTMKGGEYRPRRGYNAGGIARKKIRKDLRRLLEPPPHAALREQREPVRVNGRTVMVPWDKLWRGTVGGLPFYSPPQSTNVYLAHEPVPRAAGPGLIARLRGKAAEIAHGERGEQLGAMRARLAAGQGPVMPGEGIGRLGLLPLLGYRRTATSQTSANGRPAVEDRWRDGEGNIVTVTRGNAADGYTEIVASRVERARTPDAKLLDRPPRDFDEFKADAIAWAQRKAAEHGKALGLTDVGEDASLSDSSAYRDWDGMVRFGPDVRLAVEAAAARRAKGEPLTGSEALDMLIAQQVAMHEASHAVDVEYEYRLDAPGRRNLEEGLTEEVGLLEGAKRLRDTGQGDVLQWAADHPDRRQLAGNYRGERLALATALDRAGVAPEDRNAYVYDLKYETDPEQRLPRLARDAARQNGTGYDEELARVTSLMADPGRSPLSAPWTALPALPPEAAELRREGPTVPLGDGPPLGIGARVSYRKPVEGFEGMATGTDGTVVALDRNADGTWDAQLDDAGDTAFVHGIREGEGLPGLTVTPRAVNGIPEGSRVAWTRPDGQETEGTLDRMLASGQFGGWAFEAVTADGKRAVVTSGSTRGLRRAGGAENSPGRAGMADTGPAHNDLGWSSGTWGKGWLFGNGRLVTWGTPEMGGAPHHDDKMAELARQGKLPAGTDPEEWDAYATPLVIDADGGVALGFGGFGMLGDVGGAPDPDQMRQLRAADGSLRRPARTSPIAWPGTPERHKGEGGVTPTGDERSPGALPASDFDWWERGRWGRGLALTDGTLMLWNEDEGLHGDAMMARGIDPSEVLGRFTIAPDGRVDLSPTIPDEKAVADVLAAKAPELRPVGLIEEQSPGRAADPRQRFIDAERARMAATPQTAEDRIGLASHAERVGPAEREALLAYTDDPRRMTDEQRSALAALVGRHPLPEPVVAYRKAAAGELDGVGAGDTLAEDRLLSVSLGPTYGIGVTDDNGSMRLTLPAGTPAYYNPHNDSEHELILPPGLPLRVTSVAQLDGKPRVAATAAPEGAPSREAALDRAERDLWRARHGRGDLPAAQRAAEAARAALPQASPGRAQATPDTELGRAFAASLEGEWTLRDGRRLVSRNNDLLASWGGGTVAEGEVVDPSRPDAMPVGTYRRTFRPLGGGGYEVTKDQIWVDPAYRRQGLAAEMDAEMERRWGALGVRRVRISGTAEDGGYVWAHMGYRLDPGAYMEDVGVSERELLDGTPGFEGQSGGDAVRRAVLYRTVEANPATFEDPAERERHHEVMGITGAADQPSPERVGEVLRSIAAGELHDVGDVAALPDGRQLLWGADWAGYRDVGPSHPPNRAVAEPDVERSPGRVAAAPGLRPEFLAKVRAEREDVVGPYASSAPRRWASDRDMTPKEYGDAVAEHVGGLAREADLVVRLDEKYLARFLRGHVANQHEVAHSGGAYAPVQRARAEAGAWEIEGAEPDRGEIGYHSPAAKFAAEHPDRFPVYGYFSQGEDLPTPPGEGLFSSRRNNASQYGGAKLVLKPGAKDRTYLFLGDSLGALERGVGVPSPALRPSALSAEDDPLGYTSLGPDLPDGGSSPWPYTEAEIFGGVRPGDVDHVELASAPEGDLLAAFAKSRVPWTVGQASDRNRPQVSGAPRADRARAWTDKGHTLAELRDPETPAKNWLGERQHTSGVRRRGFERTPLGLLVSTGQPDMEKYASPALGRLLVPGSYGQSKEDAAEGVPFAADNGGFWGVPEGDYKDMAEELAKGRKKPLWVTVPDVFLHPYLTHSGRRIWAANRKDAEREAGGRVREDKKTPPHGDADATIARFEQWSQYLRHEGLPAAFVAQDGMDSPERLAWLDGHWDEIAAVFIGGSDDFKLGPGGAMLARLAHDHGKLVHVGRVNTHMRIAYARDVLRADSIDGGTFSKFKDTYLPSGLAYIPTGGPPPTEIGREWVRSAAEAARGEHAWPRPPGRDKPQWPRGFFPLAEAAGADTVSYQDLADALYAAGLSDYLHLGFEPGTPGFAVRGTPEQRGWVAEYLGVEPPANEQWPQLVAPGGDGEGELAEAAYDRLKHPKDRLGRWRDAPGAARPWQLNGPWRQKPAGPSTFASDRMAREAFEGDRPAAAQRGALERYRGDEYGPINGGLRSGGEASPGRARDDVRLLDAAVAGSRATQPVTLYRGMTHPGAVPESGEFVDRGFVSASLTENTATYFSGASHGGEPEPEQLVAEIRLPAGAVALPLAASVGSAEGEVLLPRDSAFRVVGRATERWTTRSGAPASVTHVALEYLGPRGSTGLSEARRAPQGAAARFFWAPGDVEAGKLEESFDARLHPRDRLGEWARKPGVEMSPGRAMAAYAERSAKLRPQRLGEMEAAREMGVSVPEYRERVAERLRELTAPGKVRVAMRMPTPGILGLLRDGRAKTQKETGTSGGWQGDRSHAEAPLFGEPVSPTDLPVYGYLTTPDEPDPVPENSIVAQYGPWRVVLRDSVRPRTTIFFGDSLSEFDTTTATPVPLDAPTADAVPAYSGTKPLRNLETDPGVAGTPLFFNGWLDSPVVEAEVHGGVALADVESVEYRPTGDNEAEPPGRVADLLREKGIPLAVRAPVPDVETSGQGLGSLFSPGRAGPPDVPGRVVDAARRGGATVHPKTASEPTEGFAVALAGHSSITPADEFFSGERGHENGRRVLREWLRRERKAFGADTHVGVWLDRKHGEVVLDPVDVFPPDQRDEAVAAGRARDQQAIYDLGAGAEIPTGGTGGREASPGASVPSVREQRKREQDEAAAEWARLRPGDRFEVKSDGSSGPVALAGYEVVRNDSDQYGPSLRVRDESGRETAFTPDVGSRPRRAGAPGGRPFAKGELVVRPNGRRASVLSADGDSVTVVYRSGRSARQQTFRASQLERVP